VRQALQAKVVSSGFRKIDSVMLGMLPHHDQMKDGQTTVLVGKRANLICFVAELPEEALQQISRDSAVFS
jgi:hypothetical protein